MLKKDLKFLKYLVKTVYPRYEPHCFILYMALNYCDIVKHQQIFTLHAVSSTFLRNFVGMKCVWDVDNTVVINNKNKENALKYLVATSGDTKIQRIVNVITKLLDNECEALVSYNLLHNIQNANSCSFKNSKVELKFADEVEVSLINTSSDWSQYVIDFCLKKYFDVPKILYSGDVITIDLKHYGEEIFFLSNRISNINNKLYFLCKKIVCNNVLVDGYLCGTNKTILRQTSNVQSFIPKIASYDNLDLCPGGLEDYFNLLQKAVLPFIKNSRSEFLPIFLIEGSKGCGKSVLVESIASIHGMHLYTVSSFDISANVYAQNETKLKNLFFGAKLISPTILELRNFENFGLNNEGEYDERLISHFIKEVKSLFVGNSFPLVIFCSSNKKNIPIELKRVFLKIFEIKPPSDYEREKMFKWILKSLNVESDIDINKLANRTHGFLFEDIKALVYYAVTEYFKTKSSDEYVSEKYFFEALEFMQSNYNESLGAPKVPQVRWDDVGGLNDVKEEIIKTIKLPLKHPNLLKSSGLKRSGILLYGPPGTGKTLLAKAVATECALCFLSVKGPELLNMYVGQSEQNVREVFQKARDASPCIIFFDELDSLAPNRGAAGDSGGVMDRVVSQLLAEMDGLNQKGTVFLIGATNRPDLIDPALLRPGRIDKLLYVGPCIDRVSKTSVLKALTRKFHLENKKVLEKVVDFSPQNFSGADYYGLCSGAWMSAVRRVIQKLEKDGQSTKEVSAKDVVVTVQDFKNAIKSIKPSIKPEDLAYFRKLQELK